MKKNPKKEKAVAQEIRVRIDYAAHLLHMALLGGCRSVKDIASKTDCSEEFIDKVLFAKHNLKVGEMAGMAHRFGYEVHLALADAGAKGHFEKDIIPPEEMAPDLSKG